jgi:CheY-like chemotaxis protein
MEPRREFLRIFRTEKFTVPTVLVVDDSPVDRRLAGGLLERGLDCSVTYAAHGNEALALMKERVPDLVLTDLQMPELNGLELVSAIKRDHPLVPVILMTAQGSEEIAARALRTGAASYVPKRRLAEDLLDTVVHILAAAREDGRQSRLMYHLSQGDMEFELHNDLDLIRSLVSHLHQMLCCLPLGDETERLRVIIALKEALNNAYYHGNLEIGSQSAAADQSAYFAAAQARRLEAPYRDRKIHVRAKISRTEVMFVIRDEGPGFNPGQFDATSASGHFDGPNGRGITLMRTIMDEVRYNNRGNEVTLIKRSVPEPDAELADGAAGPDEQTTPAS